jgi:basic membrane protein A
MKCIPVERTVPSQKKYRQVMVMGLSVTVAFFAIFILVSGLKTEIVKASTIKVGMIFDSPTYDDNGYRWQTIQGLIRSENELGVQGTVYTSTDPSEIEPQVQQCALDGNDLCIGVSFMLVEPISNTAAVYTQTKFAIVDGSYENYLPNVRGILFASEQVGYLAGTLAALMSQSNVIGDLGAMEIPPVTAFTEGYRNAAQCANPDVTTIISYTNDFGNPELGAQYAQGMISQGADVIFAAAGATGDGAILTTTQSSVWAIGVDTDQYYSIFLSGTITGSNYLLSSAMKRTDNAVFITISDVILGTFEPGTVIYDLADGGVGLAPFHETEASIPQSVRSRLDMVKLALMSGMIDPLDPEGPCLEIHPQYLPFSYR